MFIVGIPHIDSTNLKENKRAIEMHVRQSTSFNTTPFFKNFTLYVFMTLCVCVHAFNFGGFQASTSFWVVDSLS